MTPASAQKFAYRPDIDGLRAISVMAVLLFHAGIPGFPGGFVGVDVFFVISGYLITEMMLAEFRSTGTISLAGFWARRFKRLAPALVFFLAVTLIASIFLLERISGETGALMRAALATVAINANHFFLIANGDYFGAAAETNPLLHMWSLAVEEQFYLVWPLLLLLLLKCCRQTRQMPLLLTAIIISFGVACLWTQTHPDLAFYLMPARAWEMLAGAALAVALGQRAEKADWGGVSPRLSWTLCGLLLIAISVLSQQARFGFPGPMALLPVLGAVLVIIGGRRGAQDAGYRLLSAPVMVYIGKLSYPLYLWHWSVLVFMRSRRLYEESLALDVLALLVAFALSVFTYEIIEKKTWRVIKLESSRQKWRMIATGMLSSCAIAVLALGIGAWARYGWGYSETEKKLDATRKDMPELNCMFGQGFPSEAQVETCLPNSSKASILLWGDSHANHWRPALSKAAKEHELNLGILAMNACKPSTQTGGPANCRAFNAEIVSRLPLWRSTKNLKGIILSARWPEGLGSKTPSIVDAVNWNNGKFYSSDSTTRAEAIENLRAGLHEIVTIAEQNDITVLIIGPSPVLGFSAAHCLAVRSELECGISRREMFQYAESAIAVLEAIEAKNANVRLLWPMQFMCDGQNCPVVKNGIYMYTDDDHISASYSLNQRFEFASAMNWLVPKNAANATGEGK
jgi:peptidoglycan/LPS O-acetylase OafA/YrhL